MKQLVRRIGKTIAFVLPVVLVTTGTLAVTRVPWAPPSSGQQQVLAAAAADGSIGISAAPEHRPAERLAPQEALLRSLLHELQVHDPGTALAMLDRSMRRHPSLTPHCTALSEALGRAAVRKYHGNVRKARSFARPVCDGSFAAGVAGGH
ncbi:hypothetical protein LO771_25715 [Streptacidiphilus sp. ASG 303]|uniref:hypothetical protein n=1 Tax=Streptacidiphilus sp. ASG 303 TaxID=2896847 RepID=UPI001E5D77C1|nr:hypothetical protein [Streptacidiphilus sp. ASG 303]MCD0485694.1 hypothetical protein [Streptacidiphilus sp. ASG 303]